MFNFCCEQLQYLQLKQLLLNLIHIFLPYALANRKFNFYNLIHCLLTQKFKFKSNYYNSFLKKYNNNSHKLLQQVLDKFFCKNYTPKLNPFNVRIVQKSVLKNLEIKQVSLFVKKEDIKNINKCREIYGVVYSKIIKVKIIFCHNYYYVYFYQYSYIIFIVLYFNSVIKLLSSQLTKQQKLQYITKTILKIFKNESILMRKYIS
eukprot:TRINITY_DN434_c0_g1_i19.p1 TRINITY_DN434_c0_g1~~TRINITY_DN434_c0_g1_i19.p1  ORF type:complete len:230 (+),score=-19.06 TRINITY_DN434_c0_g1_i19:79-690(+)